MRTIKFRAWDKDAGMFGIVDRIDYEDGKIDNVYLRHAIKPLASYELLQFTGLLDKNGKEIYEGDIVRLHCSGEDGATSRMEVTATILWDEYKFRPAIQEKQVMVKGGSKDGTMQTMGTIHSWAGMHSCFAWPRYVEAIGNIYENPELLKKITYNDLTV